MALALCVVDRPSARLRNLDLAREVLVDYSAISDTQLPDNIHLEWLFPNQMKHFGCDVLLVGGDCASLKIALWDLVQNCCMLLLEQEPRRITNVGPFSIPELALLHHPHNRAEICRVLSLQQTRALLSLDSISPEFPFVRFVPELPARQFNKPAESDDELRIVQFNILHDALSGNDLAHRGGFDPVYTPFACLHWEFRKERLMEEIQRAQPHVIGLQEAPIEFTLPTLDARYKQVYISKPHTVNNGCMLLVDQNRFTVLHDASFQFGANQVAACAVAQCIATHALYLFCAAHFKAGLECEAIRAEQAQVLLAQLKLLGQAYRVSGTVLCTDLNGSPNLAAHNTCCAHFASAMRVLEGQEPEFTTRKKRLGCELVSRTIDYIFYDQAATGALTPTRYLQPPALANPSLLPNWSYPSDHIMLCVAFKS